MAITYTPLKNEFFVDGEVVKQSGRSVETLESGSFSSKPQEEVLIETAHPFELHPDIDPFVNLRPDTLPDSKEMSDVGAFRIESSNFTSNEITSNLLTEEKIKIGLKARIESSIRWFSELLKRRMLLKPRTA